MESERYVCEQCGAEVPVLNKTVHGLRCVGPQKISAGREIEGSGPSRSGPGRMIEEGEEEEEEEEEDATLLCAALDDLRPQNAEASWSCSLCTMENRLGSSSCAACGNPKQNDSVDDNQWACTRCTFLNSRTLSSCEICGSQQVDDSNVEESMHDAGDDDEGLRPPDRGQRSERLVGGETPLFSFGQFGEDSSRPIGAAQMNRVIASTIAGTLMGGISAYANNRSIARGAVEGASFGALTSSVYNEFETIASDMRESQAQQSRIRDHSNSSSNGSNSSEEESRGHFRSHGRFRVYGGEPMEFADMLRLVMSGREGVDNMDYESLLARFGDGSANRGASDETLARIPASSYTTDQSSKDENEKVTCAICLDAYAPLDDVSTLSCGHTYHASCIRKWLSHVASCPVCKRDVQ